jgi:hypothetical protein
MAEWQVTGGLTAFEKMEMAQGSLIPFSTERTRQDPFLMAMLAPDSPATFSSDWPTVAKFLAY